MTSQKDILVAAFQAALAAANPLNIVPPHLPPPPKGRTLVVGGGKAAAAMAKAVEDNWPPAAPLSGLVVTRYQHSLPLTRIDVIEASHPLPDGRGAEAARQMLVAIQQLTESDLLLVLLSGGGSSLLALPVDGITLNELRAVTKALLSCGAPIQEINTVRKHLTRFSGGQVAALSKAPVHALILSDVVGDDPTHIASGPCAPDPSSYADALALLQHYRLDPSLAVAAHLQYGIRGDIPDTPKPNEPVLHHVRNRVIASASTSLHAAQTWLEQQGVHVINLGEIEGEARDVAHAHAEMLRRQMAIMAKPVALLSGGETTVTVRNAHGHGGRNTEYLLALGLASQDLPRVWAIACDTDGIDGTEENAGAIWTPNTLLRAHAAGFNAVDCLEANDAYALFSLLDDLVITGPTRTNVNDFRLALIT